MGQGTGLGLAHVRAFCDQAGGTVELASELGVGTTLKLSLPRASRMPAACAEEAGSVPHWQSKDCRPDGHILPVLAAGSLPS